MNSLFWRRLASCAAVLLSLLHPGHGTDARADEPSTRPAVREARTFVVSPNGTDSGNDQATVDHPLASVDEALRRAMAGDTVFVRAGTYRQSISMQGFGGGTEGRPVNLFAFPGDDRPVFKGSDIVQDWKLYQGQVWKHTDWPVNSQMVFVNGRPLQQVGMPSEFYDTFRYDHPVGTGLADMAPGRFFYDKSAATLYVELADGSDPNTSLIEAAVRRRVAFFDVNRQSMHVRGLAFMHSNCGAFAEQEAGVTLCSDSLLEDCVVRWNDFAGVNLGWQAHDVQVIRCDVSDNGDVGIVASKVSNFLISQTTTNRNNWRNFKNWWHAGGIKVIPDSWGTIEKCESSNNNGPGIWFDTCSTGQPCIIRNNVCRDDYGGEAAIFFEISKNGLIENNQVFNSHRRGIYVSASRDVIVRGNLIDSTYEQRAAIEVHGMPREQYVLENVAVTGNTIQNTRAPYELIFAAPNGKTISGLTSDNNVFKQDSGPAPARFLLGEKPYTGLDAWRSATGNDWHSSDSVAGPTTRP